MINYNQYFNSQYIILASMPFVSGAIGWLTNFIAVKMLLKPIRPVKILGIYAIQGLLPKRHHELADRISASIARDFLTEQNIIDFIKNADASSVIKEYITVKWDEQFNSILQMMPAIQMFVPPEKLNEIRDKIANAFSGNTDQLMQILTDSLAGKIDLEDTIKKNILNFDLERLESIIEEIASREFRYIERLGGMIGFFIGLVQAAMVLTFF